MAVQEKQIVTVDEFWQISQRTEDKHLELIDGEIVEMPPTGEEHGYYSADLLGMIWTYVRQNDLGRVYAAETGFVLHTDAETQQTTIVGPDVAFVAKERLTPQRNVRFVPTAPDLAVEVISPSQSYGEIARKAALYLEHGTRLVWVVDAEHRTITAHSAAGVQLYGPGDKLSGSEVLPGFELAIDTLFNPG